MTKLKIDYSEARKLYIKGNYTDKGYTYPSLQEIAREFNYSLSTLTKHAANQVWLKQRTERLKLKDIINMRKDFMGKAVKLTKVCFNAISAAEFLINKVEEEQREINEGLKPFVITLASKQIWILRQAVNLIVNAQQTLDLIENGYMCPLDDIGL